jgi:uncharacterized membrane protein
VWTRLVLPRPRHKCLARTFQPAPAEQIRQAGTLAERSRGLRHVCPAHAQPLKRPGSYEAVRRQLGRCILLGLEVLIVADIVRTIIVDQTIESVAVLG